MHLRGRTNILKRLVVHAGAANLGLLMRKIFGVGTPKALQGRLRAVLSLLNALPWARRLRWKQRLFEYSQTLRRFVIHPAMSVIQSGV